MIALTCNLISFDILLINARTGSSYVHFIYGIVISISITIVSRCETLRDTSLIQLSDQEIASM